MMRERNIFKTVMLLLSAMLCLSSCAKTKTTEAATESGSETTRAKQTVNMKDKKILVAFFSRAGENYSVGNVKVGNTQVLAEMIAEATGGDLFEIKPQKAYPAGYTECTEVAKKEKDTNARPAIVGDAKVEDYDVVFLGYPNWWSDAPMAVYTFIDKHSWKGKTVVPFCTHEGSGLNNADEIKAAVKGATVLKGLGMYGHTAQNSREQAKAAVEKWLEKL